MRPLRCSSANASAAPYAARKNCLSGSKGAESSDAEWLISLASGMIFHVIIGPERGADAGLVGGISRATRGRSIGDNFLTVGPRVGLQTIVAVDSSSCRPVVMISVCDHCQS